MVFQEYFAILRTKLEIIKQTKHNSKTGYLCFNVQTGGRTGREILRFTLLSYVTMVQPTRKPISFTLVTYEIRKHSFTCCSIVFFSYVYSRIRFL